MRVSFIKKSDFPRKKVLYIFCPFCHRILQKIEALDLKDSITFKNTSQDPVARSFHMKVTGRTTVPCLYIDDKPMFESSEIGNWLEQNQKKIKG
jgi:glutaredoxin